MGRQITEMLKGVLEGIVLAVLATDPAYGYQITARLREMGFDGIAEGTVYALLVRIEGRGLVNVTKRPSKKGPPRKVYALSDTGRRALAEFWGNWGFLAERLNALRGSTAPSTDSNAHSDAPDEQQIGRHDHQNHQEGQ